MLKDKIFRRWLLIAIVLSVFSILLYSFRGFLSDKYRTYFGSGVQINAFYVVRDFYSYFSRRSAANSDVLDEDIMGLDLEESTESEGLYVVYTEGDEIFVEVDAVHKDTGMFEVVEYGKNSLSVYWDVSVRCPQESTVMVSGYSYRPMKENFDVYDEAERGDMLYTVCKDEMCETVGIECLLVKTKSMFGKPAD